MSRSNIPNLLIEGELGQNSDLSEFDQLMSSFSVNSKKIVKKSNYRIPIKYVQVSSREIF